MDRFPQPQTVFKFLVVIFALMVVNLILHPMGNILAIIILLIAFLYVGYAPNRAD